MDERKLLEIIAEFTTYSPDDMEETMDFFDDLDIDSLDLAQIILSAESAFDVDLEEEKMENIRTIGDALEILRENIDDME